MTKINKEESGWIIALSWLSALEETARDLNVKKLELYRFIIGEFLGKVRRENTN